MRVKLSEEQRLLQDMVRQFADEVVKPRATEIDRTGEFPRAYFDQAGGLGLAGVCVPEEYGGAAMDTISYCVVIEEISRVCATSGVILSVNNSLVCDPLVKYGDEAQKRDFLTPLASGKKLGCFALTEPGAGSDAGSLLTTARRDGDDYVLNGNKVFITNGTHADVAIVFAKTDPEAGNKGISAFIVPTDTPGLSRGEHEYKLGVNASGTTELAFADMRVPASLLLGGEGEGFKIAMTTLDGGRVGIAAQAVGIAQGAFDEALAYSKEREQFGRPISSFQAIQFYLADMATELDAGRLMTWKAAWTKDHKKRYTLEAAQAKLYTSEMAQRVTNKALQIHGGYGYTREYNVERYFRDARITEIYEGTSEIQKLVIASQILEKRVTIDFALTEEQELLRDEVRRFAVERIAPGVAERDREHRFPAGIIAELGELGLLGMMIPEEYGGAGMDVLSYVVAIEEIARVCPAVAVTVSVTNSVCCWPIVAFGSEELKRRVLPGLAAGALGGFGLTEPGSGSDAGALTTSAAKDGDSWVLNGEKAWITNAGVARFFVVMARTDPEAGNRGISAFVVPSDARGLSIGPAEEKLGLRASVTAPLRFEDCRIGAENRLGGLGNGFKMALATLDHSRLGIAAQAVGVHQRALDLAVAYARERHQFGVPIAQHQAIQFKLAELATALEAGRLLTYAAALAEADPEGGRLASEAKLLTSEAANRACYESLQIHGGNGFSEDYEIARLYRDVRVLTIYEGTSEMQRLVISRHLLR